MAVGFDSDLDLVSTADPALLSSGVTEAVLIVFEKELAVKNAGFLLVVVGVCDACCISDA